MRALVVGASGMLGSDLIQELNRRGHDVVAPSSSQLDLTDALSVAKVAAAEYGAVEWCFNCAGYTAVDKAEEEVDKAIALNTLGPGYLGRACAIAGIRLVHLSTDFVFDGETMEPYSEESPTNPLGHYALTKRDGEEAVVMADSGAIVVRTAWLYGPNGRCFPKSIIEAWLVGRQLRVVSDQHGSPTYAWDLASVLVDIAERAVPPGLYHAAGPDVMSWHELAVLACETYAHAHGIDRAVRIEPIATTDWPTPARRPKFSALSSAKLVSLGIGPMRPTAESMADFVSRLPR